MQPATSDAGGKQLEWWPRARQHAPPQSKKGLDSLVLLVVWTLWKERNSRIFQRSAETLGTINKRIADEVELWKISGALGLGAVALEIGPSIC
jgi:hypothetical protein